MNETQLPLLSEAIPATIPVTMVRGATIDERCTAFIEANPKVWKYFLKLCLEVKRKGARKWSSKAAFEVMRYLATVQSVGENFKLPNDFHSRFSRRAMQEEPELKGFFETRELRERNRDEQL